MQRSSPIPAIFGALLFCSALACAAPAERQTIFNDDNYQPRGAHNSLPPPRQQPRRHSSPRKSTSSPTVKVNWSWDSNSFSNSKPGNARQSKGVFHYSVVNNRIKTHRLCENYSTGSLIYRDCRKAAKRYFNEQCSSSFPAACVAAGMAP